MLDGGNFGTSQEASTLQEELADALEGYVRVARASVLRDAMTMLQAQIASRRAIIGRGGLTREELDRLAREIQRRVESIRKIVTELRTRGLKVEWEE